MNKKRLSLGVFPTPLLPLRRMEQLFPGFQLWIKRDDLSGLALGGNKVRKLEFLLADAMAQGCDAILTAGAQQSNHCRQTAAACAALGVECHLLIGGEAPSRPTGNLLLSQLLGAQIHYSGEDRTGLGLTQLSENLEASGRRCFVIPYGGSNTTGAYGFVEAAHELLLQEKEEKIRIDYIFFASSSGGTQAGLMAGLAAHGHTARIMPVRIDKDDPAGKPLVDAIARLANDLASGLSSDRRWSTDEIPLLTDYDKSGYAHTTAEEWKAIRLMARTEGVLLDPVYTGRAFYAMLDHLKKGWLPIGSTILFWHTGGTPALFAYPPVV